MFKKIKNTIFLILALVLFIAAEPPDSVLDEYIREGLANNQALKQREFSLAGSLEALKEARGMFWPSVSIEARYSRAGGGRVIEMPIGSLVNPVHLTLNKLLQAHGLQPVFPADIPNQSIPFLRETEQDTKLRIIQPLFQPAIWFNQRIKKDLAGIEQERLAAFKRQLILDIKTAYFQYLKLLRVRELLTETEKLLQENLRLNESLFRNQKQTEEVVFRARAELSRHERQQAETERDLRLAASYFNFLLNRPLETDIQTIPHEDPPSFRSWDPVALARRALERREEFRQLFYAVSAAGNNAALHRASVLPAVSAVFDYGVQGERYSFKGNDDYWMASVVLSWNLFRGGQDHARRNQALAEKNRLESQRRELEDHIRLQVEAAVQGLEVAGKTVISGRDGLEATKQAFQIVSRKYDEGMVPQIEYLKSRNDFTAAGVAHIIAIYDYYIAEARLEQASAAETLRDVFPDAPGGGQ